MMSYNEQVDLEMTYSKRHIQSTILDYIDPTTPEFIQLVEAVNEYRNTIYSYDSKNIRIAQIQIPDDQVVIEILSIVLPIQDYTPIQGICNKLSGLFQYDDDLDGIKTAAELLAVTEGPFFDLYSRDYWENPTETIAIKCNQPVEAELVEYLENVQYLPPMLIRPEPWINGSDGGWLTVKNFTVLGNDTYHNKCLALDVQNILQRIPFELNEFVLTLPEKGKGITNEGEPWNAEQWKQWEVFTRRSRQLYDQYRGRRFYFPWRPDSRGRLYSQGYHLNPQGSEYKKAVLDFEHKEFITEEI